MTSRWSSVVGHSSTENTHGVQSESRDPHANAYPMAENGHPKGRNRHGSLKRLERLVRTA